MIVKIYPYWENNNEICVEKKKLEDQYKWDVNFRDRIEFTLALKGMRLPIDLCLSIIASARVKD